MWHEVIIVIITSVVSVLATGAVGIFSGWWANKTSLPLKVIEQVGELKAANKKTWEKLIMMRKVLENAGYKVPDREWGYDEEDGK